MENNNKLKQKIDKGIIFFTALKICSILHECCETNNEEQKTLKMVSSLLNIRDKLNHWQCIILKIYKGQDSGLRKRD